MKQRLNFYAQFPEAFGKIADIEALIKKGSIDHMLIHLVKLRASQLNGCTFCIDMHVKEAVIDGEKAIRLHHIAGWRESQHFTDKERAALDWTEKVTQLSLEHISDADFLTVREHFSEKELVELTMCIGTINLWNRFAATFRATPGSLDKAYGLDKAGL